MVKISMVECKGGDVMRVLIPSEWYINIKKTDEGLYRLEYKEICVRPQEVSQENFKMAVDATLEVVKKFSKEFKFEFQYNCSDDVFEVTLTITDDLYKVADAVVSEFLPLSSIGKLTFGELYYQIVYSYLKSR